MALLRQAQEYFHALLLGVVNWDDVRVDKAVPIPPVKGNRDQGKERDIVSASFNGFRMELLGPFENEHWPLGCVKVSRGGHSFSGPLDALTWVYVANFIREHKPEGDDDGRIAGGEDWGR
jgi:hypothetical protein